MGFAWFALGVFFAAIVLFGAMLSKALYFDSWTPRRRIREQPKRFVRATDAITEYRGWAILRVEGAALADSLLVLQGIDQTSAMILDPNFFVFADGTAWRRAFSDSQRSADPIATLYGAAVANCQSLESAKSLIDRRIGVSNA